MLDKISGEMKAHAPFTLVGALTGIVLMMIFHRIPFRVSHRVFYTLHLFHVVLSAIVTASMYKLHTRDKRSFWPLLLIGYVGSIGIATLSDSLIPFLGEALLRLPNREIHVGFIEKWWLVNPLALAGVAVAYFKPTTKFPHSGHVLLSTWASLFHILMALSGKIGWGCYMAIFFILFIAVWIPCCVSDIIFPLLFVERK